MTGATAALRRAPFERLLDRLDPDEIIEPVALVPATTPVGQVVGVDRRVLALDERGMPTLLLPLASSETPDVAALDPVTPGSGAEPVLRAMATSSAGVVVVISAGQLRGLVSAERLNAVAERHLRRN